MSELLAQALAAHRQGRIAEAQRAYEEILQREPAHFDALHLLGTLALQRRDTASGVALIRRAIEINPRDPSAHLNLAVGFGDLGRVEDALACYDRAIALKPDNADAFNNRGNALQALHRLAEAIASYDRAIALAPGIAEAHSNRGNALQALKRLDDALASYDRALALKPGFAEAYSNRGGALLSLQRPDEALASYDRALELMPGNAATWCNRGAALQVLKRPEEALASCERAVALQPGLAEAWTNRGNTLLDLDRPIEALASLDRAISLKPGHARAHLTRGMALDALNRPAEALTSYTSTIAIEPDNPVAHWNESLCRLRMGDFESGWRNYEWRWRREGINVSRPNFSQQPWSGAGPLQGRTILLYSEQGAGDAIQFCRYAKLVAARGATVLLGVRSSLKSIMSRLSGVSRVLTSGEMPPEFDCHCALLSLPLAFETRLDSIPAEVPYLTSDPRRVLLWRDRLGDRPAPRVGIVWAGSATNALDHKRSIGLRRFLRAIPPGLSCYSLQKDLRDGDREALASRPDVTHLGDALEDFEDAAAVIAQMDLVISVDTALAHLAGAMGRPLWVLLPFAADWRWLVGRVDSPWYPTARLYRQPALGDWDAVLSRVREELARAISARAIAPGSTVADGAAGLAQRIAPPAQPQPAAGVGAILEQARAAHQQGRLSDALACYERVIALAPEFAEAHNNRGSILVTLGRPEEALDSFDRAITLKPGDASARSNRGCALRALRRLEEALANHDEAIALEPDVAVAYFNRGNVLQDLKRLDGALADYDRAIALKPDYRNAHYARGDTLRALQRPDEALASYDRAIALTPDHADAWYRRALVLADLNRLHEALASHDRVIALQPGDAPAHISRGNLLQRLKLTEEGVASYDKAIALEPGLASAHYNRGVALQILKRPDAALASFDRAIALGPGHAEAWSNRGNALQDLKQVDAALESYGRAIALKPDLADAHYNVGTLLQELERWEEALASYGRAIALKPDSAKARNNRGVVLQYLARFDAALADFTQAVALAPDYALAHWNESLCRLRMGEFEKGWREYEWRWQAEGLALPRRAIPHPLWLGEEPLRGRTILLHAEQGLGDTLQFVRYAPLVAKLGARVLLLVQAPLKRLLSGMQGIAAVHAEGESLPAFDCHCPFMSLPLAFGTTLATIPASIPYLRVSAASAGRWQRLLKGSKLKVGLVWAGSAREHNPRANRVDQRRSMALAQFGPLAAVPGVSFVSLQKGPPSEQARQPPAGMALADCTQELTDFADTAALVSCLDLVITVDTSVAHLAGALGKPVWILSRFDGCWRWLLDRDDSPWYPTARLFRQGAPGDWEGVIERVAKALHGWRKGARSTAPAKPARKKGRR